jgi:hypothetical protein
MITIDGVEYNVAIVDLSRSAEFLDKFAQRTESGDLERELIGVYYNHQFTIGGSTVSPDYNAFWDKITEPVAFHTVVIPGASGTYTYQAYVSGVKDKMVKHKSGLGYFKGMTVNFIAKTPARSPGVQNG